MCDWQIAQLAKYQTISVHQGFPKKPLQPLAFIARHADPKGLFQVLQKGVARYYMCLSSQPIRVYREINEKELFEVPSFDYRVQSCHDGCLTVVDPRDGKVQAFNKVDKFIEIAVK